MILQESLLLRLTMRTSIAIAIAIATSCLLAISSAAADTTPSASSATVFSFDSFSTYRNLTLLGDSFIKSSSLGLTREAAVPATGVGRALYAEPVRLSYAAENRSASFSTAFTFSISNAIDGGGGGAAAGDGLAFVIVADNSSLGSPGKWLGLVNATAAAASPAGKTRAEEADDYEQGKKPFQFLAVEFDTYLDVGFLDINDNHVGVDLGSLRSAVSADLGGLAMDLKSGVVISSWLDYNGTSETMEVRMSYTGQRPPEPVLSASFRLADLVQEFMYVGFSASTEGSQELHTLYSWSFSASLDLPVPVSNSSSDDGVFVLPPSPSPSPAGGFSSATPTDVLPRCRSSSSSSSSVPGCTKFSQFLGISVASAFVLAVLILACLVCAFRAWKSYLRVGHGGATVNKKTIISSDTRAGVLSPASSFRSCHDNETRIKVFSGPRKFTYRELRTATKGFSSGRVIGYGAFGSVYKGVLPGNGVTVAVKRSVSRNKSKNNKRSEGRSELEAELSIIGCLRHRNLVQLLGWCEEKDEILLVYEYMEKGSLDMLLFGGGGGGEEEEEVLLPWKQRFKILKGTAAAMVYLHEECERQVLHRDVKASNILLDGSFNAKLGDFGLAKVTAHDASPDATLAAGTMGYLAPEYVHTGKASEKTDVFSYGAVVLEVVCGRRPIDGGGDGGSLVDWVWGLYREGKLLEATDRRLRRKLKREVSEAEAAAAAAAEMEMEAALLMGLHCSHPDPAARPSMRHVLHVLNHNHHRNNNKESTLLLLPPLPLFKPTPSFACPPLLPLLLNLHDILSDDAADGDAAPPPHSSSSASAHSL